MSAKPAPKRQSHWHVCLACGCLINPELGEVAVPTRLSKIHRRPTAKRFRHALDTDCQAALRGANKTTGNVAYIGRYRQ